MIIAKNSKGISNIAQIAIKKNKIKNNEANTDPVNVVAEFAMT